MPVMPAKNAEFEADHPFTFDDPDGGRTPYNTGDVWQGTPEQAEALLEPVDDENGKRSALLRAKTTPRKEN